VALLFGAAQAAEFQLLQLSNRVRFIMAVINGTLRVANRKKAEVEADLAAQGFDRLPSRAASDSKRKASLTRNASVACRAPWCPHQPICFTFMAAGLLPLT
jgi:hypothetical protein